MRKWTWGKGMRKGEQGEPAAGGLQMWWLWGRATLARFRPPILTRFFPLLHLLSRWQEPSGLAESGDAAQSNPPQCGPCMPLGREYKQIKCTHARTYTMLHPHHPPPEAVTWLLTQRSCAPAVRHYDKYTKGRGVLSTRSQPSQLGGVWLQNLKAHFAEESSHFHHHKPHLFISSAFWKQTPTHSFTSRLHGRWYFTLARGVPFTAAEPAVFVGLTFWSRGHDTWFVGHL